MFTGIGVGLTVAPATGAIMSSLPSEKAGVGSAINDATRQVGAAAGVAVLGCVWASSYRGALTRVTVGARVPQQALVAGRVSIGSVAQSAQGLPRAVGADLMSAARAAFVHGSNVAYVVGSLVVLDAAALAFRYMPRGDSPADGADASLVVLDTPDVDDRTGAEIVA